jgi:hypothetical protein
MSGRAPSRSAAEPAAVTFTGDGGIAAHRFNCPATSRGSE